MVRAFLRQIGLTLLPMVHDRLVPKEQVKKLEDLIFKTTN